MYEKELSDWIKRKGVPDLNDKEIPAFIRQAYKRMLKRQEEELKKRKKA